MVAETGDCASHLVLEVAHCSVPGAGAITYYISIQSIFKDHLHKRDPGPIDIQRAYL